MGHVSGYSAFEQSVQSFFYMGKVFRHDRGIRLFSGQETVQFFNLEVQGLQLRPFQGAFFLRTTSRDQTDEEKTG